MSKLLHFELLRDAFLISADHVEMYSVAANKYLSGVPVSLSLDDLMPKLSLPAVPKNVALITMAGVLTKADFCGAQGSRTLTNMVTQAALDPSISSIIIFSENCPGGQVDGVSILGDAIKSANQIKPVMGAISGMACSAAMWVLSGCREIFATAPTDQAGCIGVMARMRNPKNVHPGEADYITLYSSLSPDKNVESRNPETFVKGYLDPVAKLFQEAVMDGRGDRLHLSKENVLSGKTYVAGEAAKWGLIDGVLSFDKIISKSIFLSKNQNKSNV